MIRVQWTDASTPRELRPSDVDAFVETIDFLQSHLVSLPRYPAVWVNRSIEHLSERLDRQLREKPRITTERQAIAMLKTIGVEVNLAAASLDAAASALKDAGSPNHASQAKQAATRLRIVGADLE